MKRFFKIAGTTGLGILLFLTIFILLLSSGSFNNWISQTICRAANQQLNAELNIGNIEGNPLSHLQINKLQITQNKQNLVAIQELEIQYNIWKIFQKKVEITHLKVSETNLFLKQEDELWNLQKLIPANENTNTETNSQPFSWKIELADVRINKFETTIESKDTSNLIPHNVKFDAAFQFLQTLNRKGFKLHQFKLETEKPTFHLNHFQVETNLVDSVFNWSNLQLQLPKSVIASNGTLPLNQLENSEIHFHATPFSFEDIHAWLPFIHGSADINLDVVKKNESSQIDLTLQQGHQILTILGEITNNSNLANFHFILKTDSLNGEYWTHQAALQSNIKGTLELSGEGLNFENNTLQARANFTDLKYNKYTVDDFTLGVDKNGNQVEATIKANTIFGNLNSKIHMDQISELANYKAELNIRKLDLSKLSANKNLKSNLNFDLQAIGQGFTLGELQSKINLQSQKSTLFNQPLTKLNANLFLHKKEYQINQIIFEAPYLKAQITGKGNFNESNLLQANLKTNNINKVLIALGTKPAVCNGDITAKLSGPSQALDFNSKINIANAQIDSLEIRNLQAKIQSHFSWNDLVTGLDSIASDSATNPLFHHLSLKTKVSADYAAYQKFYFTDVDVNAEKKQETITGQIASSGIFGKLKSKFNIQHLFSTPSYELETSVENIDFYRITENEKLHSDLNLEILAKGKGIDAESMETSLQIKSNESSIFGLPMKTLQAEINYKKGNYQIEGFHLESPFAVADLTGHGNWTKNNAVKFQVKTTDIHQFNSALGMDKLQLNAHIDAEMKGPADSLQIFSSIEINHLEMDSIKIDQIKADGNIQFVNTNYSGSFQLMAKESKIQDFQIKDIQFTSTFDQQEANNSFRFFASDSLEANITSKIIFDQNPIISFPDIHLNLHNDIWTEANKSNYIRFWQDSIEFHQIEINSKKSKLKANGMFAFRGLEDLQVDIENINLTNISDLQLLPYQFSGQLSANIDISGSANLPHIQCYIDINEPEIDSLKFRKFHSNFNYARNQLRFETYLNDYESQLVNAELELPLQFSFTEKLYLPKEDQPIHAIVSIKQLDVNKLNRFMPIEIVAKGLLSAQINIDNTINNPYLKGKLDFSKGAIRYQKLGVDYKNIELHSKLDQKHIYLDSLYLKAGKGYLQMKGAGELESLADGDFKSIQMELKGQNFKAFDSDMLKTVLNTNLSVNSSPQKASFSGKVTIINSTLNTDLFLKEIDRYYDDTNQPLLVSAQKKVEKATKKYEVKQDSSKKFTPDIFKKLKGHFDIEIPRNTWVKGKNMNFELAGNLKLIKESDEIDILGSLNIKRGFYKIYGRKLEFEEGEITLTGGSTLNPIVNFKIAYSFRDSDNELRTLNGNVTGRISKPEVAFTLDDESIEEKDAISYLIFNKSTNQLNTRENTSIKNSNLDLAKDFAIGQFSNLMKDALQSSLGLDVIEISGEDGWSQGNVSVGKYITNNLYLNYERSFAIDRKDKVVEPEKILMEYQFYRSLFLQATNQSSNSGFDFILKWSWK
ncbi:translocation/assembly module TamB domain-containing protein [Labilibaculum sp.]|uniref:translocation/assembly module TamB domain-containing protein n=1 Tax=Labilibaculum sp. TaxID=2060723 RepID=UPI0035637F5D